MYYKMLKEIETMIDVQEMIKNIKKLAEEANTVVTEIEETILWTSINNWMINATNISGISENLRFLVQSNIEEWAFQVQRMLADELDRYKGRDNSYVDKNIREIQNLYSNKKQQKKDKGKKKEEVILIKLYRVLESILTKSSSFINEEINNLLKHMKFVKSPTQTRIFWPSPHYQSLQSRKEQDSNFWKEVTIVLVDNKHNTETSRNGYSIQIFQGGPPYELFFIAINNQGQVIISPNKKMVTTYVVRELEILI